MTLRRVRYRKWLPSVLLIIGNRAVIWNLTDTQVRAVLPCLHPSNAPEG